MRAIKAMFIAFSIYSGIPVPQLAWEAEEMEYMLCFFPWIGAVIGVFVYGWRTLCDWAGIGRICYTTVGLAIPLILTGGFHVDGFMDTMDAFHSYQPKERKLEILKDSHIGAFAVIMLAAYGLVVFGAFSEITEKSLLRIVCAGFFLSRCLSGIGVISFPAAKKDGTLSYFANHSRKHVVAVILYVQAALCLVYMAIQSPAGGGLTIAAAVFSFVYYYFRTKKEFGGITGDTAGYFILICEGSILITAAAVGLLL